MERPAKNDRAATYACLAVVGALLAMFVVLGATGNDPQRGAKTFRRVGKTGDCHCGEVCSCCPAEIHVHRRPSDEPAAGNELATAYVETRVVHCPCTGAAGDE